MQEKDNTSPLELRVEENIPVTEGLDVLIWSAGSFAHEWFNDALKEAREGRDRNSRRREIVFAVCFTESYLFEWVRDEIPGLRIDELSESFPDQNRRGIRERWKEVIKALQVKNRIRQVPSFEGSYWPAFVRLIDYRDGLVHAGASRPEIDAQRTIRRPLPSLTDLDQLAAGWAVQVVVTVVKQLHQAVGTNPPAWLCEP